MSQTLGNHFARIVYEYEFIKLIEVMMIFVNSSLFLPPPIRAQPGAGRRALERAVELRGGGGGGLPGGRICRGRRVVTWGPGWAIATAASLSSDIEPRLSLQHNLVVT